MIGYSNHALYALLAIRLRGLNPDSVQDQAAEACMHMPITLCKCLMWVRQDHSCGMWDDQKQGPEHSKQKSIVHLAALPHAVCDLHHCRKAACATGHDSRPCAHECTLGNNT